MSAIQMRKFGRVNMKLKRLTFHAYDLLQFRDDFAVDVKLLINLSEQLERF